MSRVIALVPWVIGAALLIWVASDFDATVRGASEPCFFGWAVITSTWLITRAVSYRRGRAYLRESQYSTERSVELCRRVLHHHRIGRLPATALNNLSADVFHLGNAPRALLMQEEIERAGWCRGALRPLAMRNRALYLAVLGDVAEAGRCLREARLNMSTAASMELLAVDALIAARAGRFTDVVAWTGTMAARRSLNIKQLRVLRAWALRVTAPTTTGEEVNTLLAGLRPVTPGELGHVTAYWPELRTFLIEEGFADAT
jgi:hypothetical protein